MMPPFVFVARFALCAGKNRALYESDTAQQRTQPINTTRRPRPSGEEREEGDVDGRVRPRSTEHPHWGAPYLPLPGHREWVGMESHGDGVFRGQQGMYHIISSGSHHTI
uniref:Uncharacterized protein n=1 Tax=Eutreptiella gymnastica TaxID=73025 RepID=A0A7S1N8L4_9EUGL